MAEAVVAVLIDPKTGNWDFEALVTRFGVQDALHIATSEVTKPGPTGAPNTLLFTKAKNGQFSVANAYQLI